ncbi:MAG: transcriptional repressor LexA [Deltaproteobacteria bacterium]|nr:transcriptional repressor LexA [Deltaproteobacteria bacterium]
MFSANDLTPRQTEVLEFLHEFQRTEKIAPTYREIGDHFGFKSTKAAADHVYALEKKGYLRRHSGRSRGIELLPAISSNDTNAVGVPVLGDIPAGYPEQRVEQKNGTITVDPMILGGSVRHRLFALQVKGDSMEGRGIQQGDWVIVDADLSPGENDVVVALIDGKNTLKTLAQKDGFFFLKAENPDYDEWLPLEELIIQGVAKAILKRIS